MENISKRDYFAGLAMQALIGYEVDMAAVAKRSYEQADAMLEERRIASIDPFDETRPRGHAGV